MPLQPYMEYVSVDDHLLEPPDLWISRLPSAFARRAPAHRMPDRLRTTSVARPRGQRACNRRAIFSQSMGRVSPACRPRSRDRSARATSGDGPALVTQDGWRTGCEV